MKNQALFSLKDKSEKLSCRPLQFLFGALRVKNPNCSIILGVPIFIIFMMMDDDLGFYILFNSISVISG